MQSLTRLRDQAGIKSNLELAEKVRARGVMETFNASAMSKWGPGVQPSLAVLREIAHVVGVAPLELYLRAEVILAEDLGQRPIPRIFRDAIELDADIEHYARQESGLAQIFADERDRFQDSVIALVHVTRDRVQRLAETAGINTRASRRRSSKAKSSE